MKLYLENLIPRLKQFSLNLDKQEVFVDKQWVIIDENQNKQTYIFRRNGGLIMSLNGQVTMGKWEYISGAKSLLIDRIQDKILLNQSFIDPALMILKKDGFKEDDFVMANENLIPDLDVVRYLKQLYYKKNNIEIKRLKNGDYLEYKNNDLNYDFTIGTIVTVDIDKPVSDGLYESEDSVRSYLIVGGKVTKIFKISTYKTNYGDIIIEQDIFSLYGKGSRVFINNAPAPNGKYKLNFLNHIFVENGVITKNTSF